MRHCGGSESDKQRLANSGVRAQVHPILLFARPVWPSDPKQDQVTVNAQIVALRLFSQVQKSRPKAAILYDCSDGAISRGAVSCESARTSRVRQRQEVSGWRVRAQRTQQEC